MDTIPLELEENPLKLEVVIDSQTRCVTMKTHTEDTATPLTTINSIHTIIPKDPLQKEDNIEPDFDNMTDLEKLIYSERQRLLQVKKPFKQTVTKRGTTDDQELTTIEKSRLRMRKKRARETEDERADRKFRQRILTTKVRLLQRLKNFDDETYLEEVKKRNSEKIRQRRFEQLLRETPEERLERLNRTNITTRIAKLRRKAFKTPEEILKEREQRLNSLKNCPGTKAYEQRRAKEKIYRERAKERQMKTIQEKKKFALILRGKPIVDKESMEDEVI